VLYLGGEVGGFQFRYVASSERSPMGTFSRLQLNAGLLATATVCCLPVNVMAGEGRVLTHAPLAMVTGLELIQLAILPILVGSGAAVFWLRRRYSAQLRSKSALLQASCTAARQRLQDIDRKDKEDYLSDFSVWLSKLTGKSLELYKKVAGTVRELRARLHGLQSRLDEARRSAEGNGSYQATRALRRALKLLTVKPIHASVVLLPGEAHTALRGLPDEFDREITRLLEKLEKHLSELRTARQNCDTAAVNLKAAVRSVEEKQTVFTAAGFAAESYAQNLVALQNGLKSFLGAADANPCGAAEQAAELTEHARLLLTEMEQRLSCKRELESSVQTELDQLRARITEVRSQVVVCAFPSNPYEGVAVATGSMQSDSTEPAAAETSAAEPVTFKLKEENADPDYFVVQAESRIAEAVRLVLGTARVPTADLGHGSRRSRMEADYLSWHRSARQSIAEGFAVINRTLAAKESTESKASSAFARLVNLREALLDTTAQQDALVLVHAQSTWQSEADLIAEVEELLSAKDLDAAREEYAGQDYLRADERLGKFLTRVSKAQISLDKIGARLKQLDKLKQHALDTVANLSQPRASLEAKLRENRFSTSIEIAAACEGVPERLDALAAKTVAALNDWPSLDKEAVQLRADIGRLSATIDDQKSAHEKAVERMESIAGAVSEAERAVKAESARRAAITRLDDLKARYGALCKVMKTAGSDWASVPAAVDELKKLAREAARSGTTDQEVFERASRALDQAQQKQKRLGKYATGADTSEKMRIANQALADAQAKFGERAWEDAARLATQAGTSYQGALNARGG
jgi:hypothetical protein